MRKIRSALKMIFGLVFGLAILAVLVGPVFGLSGCCDCPEPGPLSVHVEVEGSGWNDPMDFWRVMYSDCIEFAHTYRAWATDCGFPSQADVEVCLAELWERGVSNMLCGELTGVYLDNLATDPTWCHASMRSSREDGCW